jgi:hypothetical protein
MCMYTFHINMLVFTVTDKYFVVIACENLACISITVKYYTLNITFTMSRQFI